MTTLGLESRPLNTQSWLETDAVKENLLSNKELNIDVLFFFILGESQNSPQEKIYSFV